MDENFLEEFRESFKVHYKISNEILNNFSQMLWENPDVALDNLFKAYNNSLNEAYTNKTGETCRAFVEATCGGPHEAIPSAFYNAVGTIYPFLSREVKNKALCKILNIMDRIRSDYVQTSHTSYIHEPLLLSDIFIVRPFYWPGLEEGQRLVNKYNNLFCDFKFEMIKENGLFEKRKVNSEFLVGYFLLRKDICNWSEGYLEIVNEKFLDRILQGVVGMSVAREFRLKNLSTEEINAIEEESEGKINYQEDKSKLEIILNSEIDNEKIRLKDLFPKPLHKKIDFFVNKKDWIDPFLGGYNKNHLLLYEISKFLDRNI